jgi:esterase/lipase
MKHLLLLHGALGSAKQLDPLKEILSENYKVSSLNFSGHGGQALPSAFTIDLFVDEVIFFFKK